MNNKHKLVAIRLEKQRALTLRRERAIKHLGGGKKRLETLHPPDPLLLLRIYWRETNTDVHTRTCTFKVPGSIWCNGPKWNNQHAHQLVNKLSSCSAI